MAFTRLPTTVALPGGLVAELALDPMPQANGKGGYDLVGMPGGPVSPEIRVSFLRDGAVVHDGTWNSIISGAKAVVLSDGTQLGVDSLNQLDSEGWEILWGYGIVPASFV